MTQGDEAGEGREGLLPAAGRGALQMSPTEVHALTHSGRLAIIGPHWNSVRAG